MKIGKKFYSRKTTILRIPPKTETQRNTIWKKLRTIQINSSLFIYNNFTTRLIHNTIKKVFEKLENGKMWSIFIIQLFILHRFTERRNFLQFKKMFALFLLLFKKMIKKFSWFYSLYMWLVCEIKKFHSNFQKLRVIFTNLYETKSKSRKMGLFCSSPRVSQIAR